MSQLVKSIVLITVAYLLLLIFMPYFGIGVFYIGRFVGYFFYPINFLSHFIYTPSWVFQFWAVYPFVIVGLILYKLGIRIFTKG